MVSKGGGYPGMFWNDADLHLGTATANWTVEAYGLLPFALGGGNPPYFSNVYPAPVTVLNGSDAIIAANALVVDLLNPPSA